MTESIESKVNRLRQQFSQFSAQIQADQADQADQLNRKMIQVAAPAETVETPDEMMVRIHNSKPSRRGINLTMPPVTRIRVNGRTVEDYGPIFESSKGKEYNLKNYSDQYSFMETYWPDCPLEQWPVIFNKLLTRGRISKDGAPDFVRQLKAGRAR